MKIHSLYGTAFETTEAFRHPIPSGEGPVAFRYDSGDPPPGAGELTTSSPAFETSSTIPSGRPFFSIHRNEDFDLVRFSEVVDFYVGSDLIRAVVHDPDFRSAIELYFLGFVLSWWMERHHRPVLHAAVVAREGRAVALLAGNKSGKSSLAVGCLEQGWSLLADDLLPLDERSSGFWAHPGYPELRLWPDAADAMLGGSGHLPKVHPAEEKRRVPVGTPGGVEGGRFSTEAVLLDAVVIPRRDIDRRSVEIRPVESKKEALQELIKGSFMGSLPRVIGVDAWRFQALGRVVLKVPVLHLDYPAGWEEIPGVVDAIADSLRRE